MDIPTIQAKKNWLGLGINGQILFPKGRVYSGTKLHLVVRVHDMARENSRLNKAVAILTLDILSHLEALEGNY